MANKPLSTIVEKCSARILRHQPHKALGVEGILEDLMLVAAKGKDAYDAYKEGEEILREGSLVEYTKVANLEPRAMVEESLRSLPNMGAHLMALTNLFTAYYLQAISLSANINGVNVIGVLDKFNPNRDADYSRFLDKRYSKECLIDNGYVLPNFKDNKTGLANNHNAKFSFEDVPEMKNTKSNNSLFDQMKKDIKDQVKAELKEEEAGKVPPNQIKADLKKISDLDNLAVGRIVEANLTIDGHNVRVPIAIRIRPMSVPRLIMRELVALGDIKESWRERWYRMRAGEISFLSDWVFQSDRIRDRKKLLALDKDGIYKDMIARRRNNKVAAMRSGQASIGAASSFMLISSSTLKEVEARIGAKIEVPMVRERIFGENSAMMLLIYDLEWEQITIYTRGIKIPAQYSFKEFEGFGKGNGPDITDVMKAFMAGTNPRF